MRIGFDCQVFSFQKYGGISRYFTDLYLGLLEKPGVKSELLFRHHNNGYLKDLGIGIDMHPLAARLYFKVMIKGGFHVPISKKNDIHHSTYYLGRPKRINSTARLVSSLYDMIPELFPKFFNTNPHANKLEWFAKSDLIISISDSSTSDLVYLRPDLESRIRRIHLYSGFNKKSVQAKPNAFKKDEPPYLLFIGNRGDYKNAKMLIRAFAASEPNRHGHQLIFAGGGAFNRKEREIIDGSRLTRNIKQIGVSDKELWYLYLNAKCVLAPSMAEGFSLPLVEGLVADVPVVCSDIPVHREVASNFAILVNPLQHQDWENIFNSVGHLKKPSKILGEKAYKERCVYFSKERMVEEHITAYSHLLA